LLREGFDSATRCIAKRDAAVALANGERNGVRAAAQR
jgi:hypothetical protein